MSNKFLDDAMQEIEAEIYSKKIADLQEKKRQIEEAIKQLKSQKAKSLSPVVLPTIKDKELFSTNESKTNKSLRQRIIMAIAMVSDPYNLDSLLEIVNKDGGEPVTNIATFRSTHSRLGGEYQEVVSKGTGIGQPTLYQKINKREGL